MAAKDVPRSCSLGFVGVMLRLISLFAILGCVGCDSNLIAGYGDLYDASKFSSAALMPGTERILFSFKRLEYRPAVGWRAFPDGGVPRYDEDMEILGVVGLDGSGMKVVARKENKEFVQGEGEVVITGVCADRALISQSGQNRRTLMPVKRFYWMRLDTGALEAVDFVEGMITQGRLPLIYLVDPKRCRFVLADSPSEQRAGNIWLREESGSHKFIGTAVHYYGFQDDEVHYYSPDHRYEVVDAETGMRREGTKQEYSKLFGQPAPGIKVQVSFDRKSIEVRDSAVNGGAARKLSVNFDEIR